MTLLVDVLEKHGLDSIDVVLFALPGVGDVGKNAVELLNEANEARAVARFIHPGLTPLARLDEDGLLAPPHLAATNRYRKRSIDPYHYWTRSTQ